MLVLHCLGVIAACFTDGLGLPFVECLKITKASECLCQCLRRAIQHKFFALSVATADHEERNNGDHGILN